MQISFQYHLTCGDLPFDPPGGAPVVPDPEPTNNDVSLFTISGLPVPSTCIVHAWAVSHAGLRSVTTASFQWQILPAAPDVLVLARPDDLSGSKYPQFLFALDLGANSVDVSSNSAIVYEVSLIGDPELTAFHTPNACSFVPSPTSTSTSSVGQLRPGLSQRDCKSVVCNASSCAISILLPTPTTYVRLVVLERTPSCACIVVHLA